MRNIFKKSLFIVLGCLMASAVWGTSAVALQGGSYSTTSAASTGGSKKFNMTQNIYYGRNGGGLTGNNGIEVKSGSMIALKLGVAATIKFNVKNTKTKSITDIWDVKAISDADFDGIIAQYDAGGNAATYYTNSSSVLSTLTITHTGVTESYTNETSSLQPGCYGFYINSHSADGDFITEVVITSAGPSVSTDATLSSLTYNGTSVPNFAATTLSYDVELPAGTTAVPTVAAVKHDTKASDPVITQASALPGTATVVVTAEDGTTTKTYTVNFTVASSAPKVTSATWANIKGSATIDQVNKTITGQVTHGSSLTAITPTFNGTNIDHYTPTGAQNFSAPVNYVFFSSSTESTQYTVTITEAEDEPVVPVPTTDLTLHMPEVYEASTAAGGYGGELKEFNSREYEVYYSTYDIKDSLAVAVTPGRKTEGMTTTITKTSCKAKDGWFEMSTTESKGDYTMTAKDEFAGGSTAVHKLKNNAYYKFHIKGYDQFSFYGKDNTGGATSAKRFDVYIDEQKQTVSPNNTASIRRFDITTGEHVIEVRGISGSSSEFYGFSLRVAQEPRVKYLDGNDSTQVVYQGASPEPVSYYTKYNNIPGAQTVLEWDGATANGITLSPAGSDALGDTLVIGGTANCQCGTYKFNVVSKYNGVATRSIPGTLRVATTFRADSRDTVFEAFKGEEMDQIVFIYQALSADSMKLTWNSTAPAGIGGHGIDGTNKYVISGTPTVTGNYKFTITIGGGETVFNGELQISSVDLTDHPVMYLYKNSMAYEKDGVYQYLKSAEGGSVNLIPRKANSDGVRAQYNYDWILISEDVDADNAEVLALIRDNAAGKPILNMKGFTYAKGRLDWGEPNNGSIDSVTNNGCYIYLEQPTHPIFSGISATNGKILVLNKVLNKKGVMPIDINNCPGTLCLATAYTRSRDDYYRDGEKQTIIHEIPVKGSGQKNYICFPLANTKDNLTPNGKKLIKNIVSYLIGTQHFSNLPTLEMTSFSLQDNNNTYTATIDQEKNQINLNMTLEQFEEDSLRAVKAVIGLADEKSHVVPGTDEELDLRYTTFLPKTFVVTDYINRRAYSFFVNITRTEGIDEVYEVGQWVNVFDIYGRKIATTNEDIYSMDLPRGMYIIVTEKGQSIKLMK